MKETLCTTAPECTAQTTSVRLDIPVDLLEQIQEAATLDGTSHKSLMVCYILEGLQDSKANVKRMQFTEQAKTILEKHGVHENAIDEIFNKFPY